MLKLIKKGDKYWLFEDSEIGLFSPSKFTINLLNNVITIVYENGLKSKNYNVIDCEIYDLGELTPFTTSSGNLFMQKLEELNCPCFQKNQNIYNISGGAWGDITGTLSDQTDLQTALNLKLDKDTTAGVERAYIVNADGSQSTKATSEFGGREIYIENISVTGGYTVDFNVDTHRLTLTGNTTFSEINLPPVGFSKTITLHINGNFGVVFPASWTQYISGAYKGTAPLNTIVIETIGAERKVQISQPD